jgi:putative endonuclease
MKNYLKAEIFISNLYQKNGWSLLKHSYRGVGFEIDLIMSKKNFLVFIEVKYRKSCDSSEDFLTNLMNYKKRQALQRGAEKFVSTVDRYDNFRFDLAVLTKISGDFQTRIFPDIVIFS